MIYFPPQFSGTKNKHMNIALSVAQGEQRQMKAHTKTEGDYVSLHTPICLPLFLVQGCMSVPTPAPYPP